MVVRKTETLLKAIRLYCFFVLQIGFLFQCSIAPAESQLPNPLTLEYALSLVEHPHPDVQKTKYNLDIAIAKNAIVQSNTAFKSYAQINARWIQPSDIARDQTRQDHSVKLTVTKRLFDFGQSNAELAASKAEVASKKWLLQSKLSQRRIATMRSFFDVLLSDLKFVHENEAMTMAFLIYERVLDRNKLGQVSDIEVLKSEADYQAFRRVRYGSQLQQRITRAKLAALLNHPGQLPETLTLPELNDLKEKIPDLEQLTNNAVNNNPILQSLKKQLVKLQKNIEVARQTTFPKLNGVFEIGAYTRTISSRDDWRTSLILDIPLYSGGKFKAEKLQKQAEYQFAASALALQEIEVKQTVLELWSELKLLRVQRQEMNSLMNYRELYIDRSRTLYELEVKADLGDAMVQISATRLRSARTEYLIAIVKEKLKAITGTL